MTKPGQTISKSTLREFRVTILDQDDVLQPSFYTNVVFYGSKKEDLCIESDAREELAAWNTEHWTCVEGNDDGQIAPGPYVFGKGATWQPWRIYHDFNSTFMCAFKPSSDFSGR
jgi:hypothetical protein